MKTQESGHAINIAHFDLLIQSCTQLGADYNPTKSTLQLTALASLYADAHSILQAVIDEKVNLSKAINHRIDLFSPLQTIATRVQNALAVTEALPETLSNAATISRKIHGTRKTKIAKPEDPNTDPKHHSVSQQSFDSLVESFYALIMIAKAENTYTPNEAELQITNLKTYYDDLLKSNQDAAKAYTKMDNKRIERNKILYTPYTGLLDTALDVKKYFKSIFGANSSQYRQVNGIKFKTF
jgi:hypothetical protein